MLQPGQYNEYISISLTHISYYDLNKIIHVSMNVLIEIPKQTYHGKTLRLTMNVGFGRDYCIMV